MYTRLSHPVAYLGFHFGGGGSNFFWKSGGLLEGFGPSGACSPEKIFKNSAIWCVLESILLKFCQKKNDIKNSNFFI